MNNIDDLKRNFFNTAIADIYRSIEGGAYTGAFILNFCLIDSLGFIEFGTSSNSFNKIIRKRYLPLNIFYTGKEEELYSIRNGLVHAYGPSKEITKKRYGGYELMYENCAFHLQKVNNNILKICLYSFLTETVFVAHTMFEEFRASMTDEQKERISQQIQTRGHNSKPTRLYADIHPALACLDSVQGISLNDIKSDYTTKVLYPDMKQVG
jgi:hypothetical protein